MPIDDRGFWTGSAMERPYGQSVAFNRWISEYLKRQPTAPIYDLGCGGGHLLATLQDAGVQDLTGFEGEPMPFDANLADKHRHDPYSLDSYGAGRVFQNVIQQDITQRIYARLPGHAICIEVAEHIPDRLLPDLLANLRVLVMPGGKMIASWAIRGQPGHGHVSCLDNWEAIARFENAGFRVVENATREARDLDHGGCVWFRNTTLIMEKT